MERLTINGLDGTVNIQPWVTRHEIAHRLAAIEDILGDEYDPDELSKAMAALRREQE